MQASLISGSQLQETTDGGKRKHTNICSTGRMSQVAWEGTECSRPNMESQLYLYFDYSHQGIGLIHLIQHLNYLWRLQDMFIDNFQIYLFVPVLWVTFYRMNIFVLWLLSFLSTIRIRTVVPKKGIPGTRRESFYSALCYAFTLVHPSEI